MPRYIDADLLWKAFDTAHLFDDGNPRHIAQQIIEEAPMVDVVDVVRCKSCAYWAGSDYEGCCLQNGLATRMANEYCSRGERNVR